MAHLAHGIAPPVVEVLLVFLSWCATSRLIRLTQQVPVADLQKKTFMQTIPSHKGRSSAAVERFPSRIAPR
jgi:hypothetical protein